MANASKDDVGTLNSFIVRETLPCWVTWNKRVDALDAQDALDRVRDGQGESVGAPEIGDNIDGVPEQDDVVAPDDGGFDAPDPLAGLVSATYRNSDRVETRILASAALAEEWRQEIAMQARADRYPFVFDHAAVSLDRKETADAFFAYLKEYDEQSGFDVAPANVQATIGTKQIFGWSLVDEYMGFVAKVGPFDFSGLDFEPAFRGQAAQTLVDVIRETRAADVYLMPLLEDPGPSCFIDDLHDFEKTDYPSP